MALSGSQYQQLQQALLSAFPTHSALAQMVQFGLDQNLDAIAGTDNLADQVFQLIRWAQAQGKAEKLIAAAYDQNPTNPTLKTYVEGFRYSSETSVQPNPVSQSVHPLPSSTFSQPPSDGPPPIELFYSYSHRDEKLREKLETHLALLKRQGVIAAWHDRKIGAGQEWANQIDQHLNTAQIVLLLVSADFLASDYCYDIELKRAMERHEAGEAQVIPVILREVDWLGAPFGKLKALPTDAKAVTSRSWHNLDEAFADVAHGIRNAVEDIVGKVGSPQVSQPISHPVVELSSELQQADVALITALRMELDAVVKHLSAHTQVYSTKEGNRTYYHCTTSTGLRVVAGVALGMGQLNAALLARDLITTWQPKKVLLVGVAAGIAQDVQLGDLVISEQIVDYELGKVTPDRTDTRWSVYRTDANLLDSALNFRDRTWIDEITVERPDKDWQSNPKIHPGVVLSGNKVIADAETAGTLREVWSRAIALEMEAAGIAAAIYQMDDGPQFIMIKGVCDRADVAKDDAWQEYAADIAAAFAAAFVGFRMQTQDLRPSPNPTTPAALTDPSLNEALFWVLTQAYNMDELKVLAFRLGVDWDDFTGDIKSLRVVNLVQYLQRRQKVPSLVQRIKEERPGLLETYQTRSSTAGGDATNP